MKIHISTQDGMPIYRQIIAQVNHLVASGRLRPGDELPSIRALAETLLINPNTVARAYRDLEAAGVIVSRRGSGTTVADGPSPLARRERTRILTERIDALLAEAGQLDFDIKEVLDMIQKRHRSMTPGESQKRNHHHD